VGAHGYFNKAIRRRRESGLCGVTGGMVCVGSITTRGAPLVREAQLLATPDLFTAAPRAQCSVAGNSFTASGTDKTNTSLNSTNDL